MSAALDLAHDTLILLGMVGLAVWWLGDALKQLRTMHTRPFRPYRTAFCLVAAALFVAGFFFVGDRL